MIDCRQQGIQPIRTLGTAVTIGEMGSLLEKASEEFGDDSSIYCWNGTPGLAVRGAKQEGEDLRIIFNPCG
jgi:hypothetical protein